MVIVVLEKAGSWYLVCHLWILKRNPAETDKSYLFCKFLYTLISGAEYPGQFVSLSEHYLKRMMLNFAERSLQMISAKAECLFTLLSQCFECFMFDLLSDFIKIKRNILSYFIFGNLCDGMCVIM